MFIDALQSSIEIFDKAFCLSLFDPMPGPLTSSRYRCRLAASQYAGTILRTLLMHRACIKISPCASRAASILAARQGGAGPGERLLEEALVDGFLYEFIHARLIDIVEFAAGYVRLHDKTNAVHVDGQRRDVQL
jgi:hypothetical protein